MTRLVLLFLLLAACRPHPHPSTTQGDNDWVKDACPEDHPELWINAKYERCCDGTSYRGCLDRHKAPSDDDFCLETPLASGPYPMDELHLMRDGTWLCCERGQALNCGN